MIPRKLSLKNFLSYGEQIQTIDFKDYPLICLSGKNGHGKSAMLDALTWVLWGQARKISGAAKPDAGLLRLGQNFMMVSLEFEFNSQRYRVRREFAKTYGKNYAALDFEMFNQQKDAFVPLSEKTIRLTQARIEKLLGLDYETFVNTSFLRQGQANEFSQKNPKERKEIIASILRLSHYDVLRSSALEQVKVFTEEGKLQRRLQEQGTAELAKEPLLGEELKKAHASLAAITAQISSIERQASDLEKKYRFFLEQKQRHESLQLQQEKLQKSFDQKVGTFKKLVARWQEVHAQRLAVPDMTSLEKELKACMEKELALRNKQQKNLTFQEIILAQQRRFQEAYTTKKEVLLRGLYEEKRALDRREVEHEGINRVIEDHKARVRDLQKQMTQSMGEYDSLVKGNTQYYAFQKRFEKEKAVFDKRRSYYQVFVQRGNWLTAQLREIEQKKQSIVKNNDPSCPLCEQLLTVKRKGFLFQKFSVDERSLSVRHGRISRVLTDLKAILFKQHDYITTLSKEDDAYKDRLIKQKQYLQRLEALKGEKETIIDLIAKQEAGYKKEKKGLEKARKKLSGIEKEIVSVLDNDEILRNVKAALEKAQKDQAALAYDAALHKQVITQYQQYQKQLERLRAFEKVVASQESRRETIRDLVSELKACKGDGKILAEKISELSLDAVQGPQLELQIKKAKKEMGGILQKKEEQCQRIGSLENELARIRKIKQEQKERKGRLVVLDKNVVEYQTLGQIFSKDGIQALIIEESIPEIEEEANSILSRLTDNNAQILIESLRDLKKGGMKETLDIQISDSAGIRSYELFSGGEAFRIDFALRIAISKLLARRAGTALQTLIIDEGFGSQDDEGLQRLMSAIHAIKDDFVRIIVVSHLPVFRDNFPVHFMVEKLPGGSVVNVVERG